MKILEIDNLPATLMNECGFACPEADQCYDAETLTHPNMPGVIIPINLIDNGYSPSFESLEALILEVYEQAIDLGAKLKA